MYINKKKHFKPFKKTRTFREHPKKLSFHNSQETLANVRINCFVSEVQSGSRPTLKADYTYNKKKKSESEKVK